jgi:hypothetical protein
MLSLESSALSLSSFHLNCFHLLEASFKELNIINACEHFLIIILKWLAVNTILDYHQTSRPQGESKDDN